jgi:hypothetical protein
MMDNIKMGIKEMGCEDVGWFHWQAVYEQGSEPSRFTKDGKFPVRVSDFHLPVIHVPFSSLCSLYLVRYST